MSANLLLPLPIAAPLTRPQLQAQPAKMDIFEAGIQVIWLPWPGHKVLGEVIAVSGNRVRIAFEGRGLKGEPMVFRFWVNPKWLRAVCRECHYFEAMPNSQSCAACWNWKMAEDFEGLEEKVEAEVAAL